ncbi:MAG TPA: DivIVA domain-containing protein [Actinomycetota bacterium]
MQEQTNGDRPDAMTNLAPADWALADEIRRRRFSVVPDGYSPDEVHDYLGHLAGTFATLRSQIGELRRATVPTAGPEGMSDLAARMADVLREAEDHANQLRQEAEQESTKLVADARQEADRVLDEARKEADRTVVAARTDAEKSVAGHVEAARNAAVEADKAVSAANAEAAKVVAEAREEAGRVRAGAEEAAAQARSDADRRTAEALEFRDMVLVELRGAVERIATAAPAFPSDERGSEPEPSGHPMSAGSPVESSPLGVSSPAVDQDVDADVMS